MRQILRHDGERGPYWACPVLSFSIIRTRTVPEAVAKRTPMMRECFGLRGRSFAHPWGERPLPLVVINDDEAYRTCRKISARPIVPAVRRLRAARPPGQDGRVGGRCKLLDKSVLQHPLPPCGGSKRRSRGDSVNRRSDRSIRRFAQGQRTSETLHVPVRAFGRCGRHGPSGRTTTFQIPSPTLDRQDG